MVPLDLLKVNYEFIHLPAEVWNKEESYIKAADKVRKINVINDSAERGVKLSQDLLNIAKGEEHYQNVLQEVEVSRVKRSSYRQMKHISYLNCKYR